MHTTHTRNGPDVTLTHIVLVLLLLLMLLSCCNTQVDPADASSSRSHPDQVPNRLALLMCQAMLMRGDDAQQKLEAAVGYLATCELHRGSHALRLPAMLAGCMEALFAAEDWDR